MMIVKFECPQCHEQIEYKPSDRNERVIEKIELTSARPAIVIINCRHCPAAIEINTRTGTPTLIDGASAKRERTRIGGAIYDMTFSEKTKEEAAKLIEQGDLLVSRDPMRAEAAFRAALSLSKHHPNAWYNLGVCRYRARDFAGAAECYRHALKFDPSLREGWNNLAGTLAQLGRLAEADECFDKGIAVDSNYPKFYLGKSHIAMMKGQAEKAIRLLHLALEKDPSYEPARIALERLYGAAGIGDRK